MSSNLPLEQLLTPLILFIQPLDHPNSNLDKRMRIFPQNLFTMIALEQFKFSDRAMQCSYSDFFMLQISQAIDHLH